MASINEWRRAPEPARLRLLGEMVDHLAHQIENRLIPPATARRRASDLRFQVGLLFPDKRDTFDLIYGSRFKRLIEQFLLET